MWKQLIIEIKTILDSNPHLGGDLNLYQSENNQHNILLALPDGISSSVFQPSGIAIKGTAGEILSEGNLCYLNSDKKWYKSTSGDESTLPSMGVASEDATIDSNIYFILEGKIQYPSVIFSNIQTNGTSSFVSSGGSGQTNDLSSISDSFIQTSGHVVDSNTLFFSPDYTVLEKT